MLGSCFAGLQVLIGTLMEETKRLVEEKHWFENRDESILLADFDPTSSDCRYSVAPPKIDLFHMKWPPTFEM